MKGVNRLTLRIYTISIGYECGEDYFLPIVSGMARKVDIEIFCGSSFKDTNRRYVSVTTTDGREKPFEMKMQFHKAVVKVLVIVATDRTKTPVSLTFEDGKEYSIDRVCSRQRAAATKVGGTGIRYTIMIGGRQTYLFEDEDQCFVEAKNLHI